MGGTVAVTICRCGGRPRGECRISGRSEDSASGAFGVSADGSVVVGMAEDANGMRRAFRWTAVSGLQYLDTLGGFESAAYGVSADGSVVVGRSTNAANSYHAFRWTAAGGMPDLGTMGGTYSEGYDVSSDGSAIVGDAAGTTG